MARIPLPPPFEASFEGPEGRYSASYVPRGEWDDGLVRVNIASHEMWWGVEIAEQEGTSLSVCGITSGTQEIWNDVFWFEIICSPEPKSIRYWGDRIIWREDSAVID
ncbi:hypothetical protein [Qipengyuania psychrotolerans]|uniref:Integron gene cassette protein n=1 Tax=Qipengyuania psychrotolerans TaxID=2867238 RepID=A0ABX8ZLS8_9SPHN|nr:hypothetical protein [Qipengyuania psychrotolerans]QZD88143.1 hypothetical protein K3166_05575 [Qipengyuania psychrotolerans]